MGKKGRICGGHLGLKWLAGGLCASLLMFSGFTAPALADDTVQDGEKQPVKFDWLFQATGYLTHSKLMSGSQILGGNGSVVAAPVLQFDQSKALMLLYNGSYRKSKQVYAQDEGPQALIRGPDTQFYPHLSLCLVAAAGDQSVAGLYRYAHQGDICR